MADETSSNFPECFIGRSCPTSGYLDLSSDTKGAENDAEWAEVIEDGYVDLDRRKSVVDGRFTAQQLRLIADRMDALNVSLGRFTRELKQAENG